MWKPLDNDLEMRNCLDITELCTKKSWHSQCYNLISVTQKKEVHLMQLLGQF